MSELHVTGAENGAKRAENRVSGEQSGERTFQKTIERQRSVGQGREAAEQRGD